jgi:hypothetical protein
LGLDWLRSYATGDGTALNLDGMDLQVVRHGLVMAWHGVCAMQEIRAKLPLPGQEQELGSPPAVRPSTRQRGEPHEG